MGRAKEVIWESLAWQGTEAFRLTVKEQKIFGRGIVVGRSDTHMQFAVAYSVALTTGWAVEAAEIKSLFDDRAITLTHKGEKWYDGAGEHLAAFDGVPFIDISLTPFSNTIPIQQLVFRGDTPQKIDVLYIDLPDFSTRKVQQYYSRRNAKTYRYQDIETPDFAADITVDTDGLVVDYPQLFKRVA